MMIERKTKQKKKLPKNQRALLVLLSSVFSWPPKNFVSVIQWTFMWENNNDVFIFWGCFHDSIQTFTCVGRSNEIIIEIYISHFFSVVTVNLFSLPVIKANKPARCTAQKNSRHKQIPMKTPSTFITLKSHATHFMFSHFFYARERPMILMWQLLKYRNVFIILRVSVPFIAIIHLVASSSFALSAWL